MRFKEGVCAKFVPGSQFRDVRRRKRVVVTTYHSFSICPKVFRWSLKYNTATSLEEFGSTKGRFKS